MQIRSASLNNRPRIHTWQVPEPLHEHTAQNRLANRDEDGASELLRPERDGHARRDLFPWQGRLYSEANSLHAAAEAKTHEELIRDPLR